MTAQGIYYLIRALVTLVAIPFHEAGHALASWMLGDDTAKREGRLSLNPFAHFDCWAPCAWCLQGWAGQSPSPPIPGTSKTPRWAWR